MFTEVTRPVVSFQVAPAMRQAEAMPAVGLWEFPSEAELAEELFAALSAPLPVVAAPEIAPEDFDHFCRGFLS